MKPQDFAQLQHGDIVESADGVIYMVTSSYGARVTAVRTTDLTNCFEWKLIAKATYVSVPE